MAWGAKVGKRMAAPLTSLNNSLAEQVRLTLSESGDHFVWVCWCHAVAVCAVGFMHTSIIGCTALSVAAKASTLFCPMHHVDAEGSSGLSQY